MMKFKVLYIFYAIAILMADISLSLWATDTNNWSEGGGSYASGGTWSSGGHHK